jgi:hypothetical protein
MLDWDKRAPRWTRNGLRHLQVVAVASLAETLGDAVAVLHVAILAHLPLALEPRDGKAEADDAAQHVQLL